MSTATENIKEQFTIVFVWRVSFTQSHLSADETKEIRLQYRISCVLFQGLSHCYAPVEGCSPAEEEVLE